MKSRHTWPALTAASLTAVVLASAPAHAVGGGGTAGEVDERTLASTAHSQIQVSYVKGGDGKGKKGNLAPIDPNWKPPACWYEPLFTPEQLKAFVKKTDGEGMVGIHQGWYGRSLWENHYAKGKDEPNIDAENTIAKGYDNYNIGKKGYFWRSVAPDDTDPRSSACDKVMFWQDQGEIPDVPHTPTPKTLAEYAYDKVEIPETEIELKPQAKSTVNLPTWVWLDKGTFKDVQVRAELPKTGIWAETTATPKSLHLEPGTEDSETFPASGECEINEDGSIGTPYTKGKSKQDPPCGISYLRATDGKPYQLKASITWEISWEGSDNDGKHMLPEGTFETTRDMEVQEVQSINR
ncbi:hypothetical protein GCM10010277_75550 [Streptomyces longisporoflavus]|uniref:hypothetical protein n=1 Tax=Streptomyces longisporoflavus TaxID=28044 RepID=UPI00167CD6CF|nr:hypothetical protein [Streptomyces longisporoflavus]GGV67163.1 hypothetical protein GCM10010277_75550 [Streptomyces longisporoflavus]